MTPKEEFLNRTNELKKAIVEMYIAFMKAIDVIEKNTLIVTENTNIDTKKLSDEDNKYIDIAYDKSLSVLENFKRLSTIDIPVFMLKTFNDNFMSILNEEDNTDEQLHTNN